MQLSPSLRKRRRLEMCLARQGIPEVPLLGRYNYQHVGTPIPEHTHGDILEICFLVRGRQTYRVGGKQYHLRGGDVFVTFPNERHDSAGTPEDKGVLYWMMVRKPGKTFFGLPPRESGRLWNALCQMPFRHFRGSLKMKEDLDLLTALSQGPGFNLRQVHLLSGVLSFLLEVAGCSRRVSNLQSRDGSPRAIQEVLTYIDTHVEETLPVPQLALQAGLSTARFKARFKEEMGVPPAEYVLRTKVTEARNRLSVGQGNITEVAYGLGFSSSQYFATVFKRFTGMSPRNCLVR